MTKLIHKKLTSLILVIIFFVAGFGASAETTSAATYPSTSPSQIRIDLSDWLLNESIPSVDIQPTEITGVRAIPSDLYTPEHQWQADKIISNIKKNPVVINRVKEASNAQDSCNKAVLTCLLGLPSDELTALNKAMDALVESLVAARDAQDSTIQGYQAQNMADEAINNKYSTYSDIASSSDAGISAINQIDIGNSSQAPGITQEQIEASRLAQQNASAWNTDDTVMLKMQENCSVGVFGEMNLMPCVAEVVYKVIYKPTAYALMGAGYIFDQILSLSIEGAMVAPPFIDSTWKVVRDFSNMIFIFVLLYTGIQTILGIGGWQKTIRNVIIIALLINFSLFFTKVVIDAGNVLAVGVKSAISTTSVSEGLAAAFQPQQFLSAATKGPDTSGGDAIIVFLVAAVVSGFAAYIFFKVSLLFMGRLIAFWGLMIISPFAFISMAMPKGNIFNDWLDMLVKQSFVAPVFLFFVYIIMKVISGGTGILGGFTQTGDWFKDLLGPVIVATLLILALKQALDIATDMSGKMGKLGSDMVGKAMGATAIVATGGAGIIGRQAIGGMAASALKAGGEEFAKTNMGAVARWATRASFDVRNVGAISKGFGALGIDAGKGTGAGGRVATEEKRIKEELKAAEASKVSIFTEQGIRARAEEEEEKKGGEKRKEEIEAAETFAKAASQRTAELKESVKAAQEEHDRPVKEAEMVYKESQQKFEKYKGTEYEPLYQKAMDEAKDKIATAKATQSSSPTSVALKTTLAKIEAEKKAAQEAEKGALEKLRVAKLSAEEVAKEAVTKINKAAIEASAEKVGGGYFSFSGGYTKARLTTADKIRKMNKEKTDEEKFAEYAKKIALKKEKEEKEKEASESGEKKEETKHEAEPKH